MGLTASDVSDITAAWKETVAAVHTAALAAKRWIFQLFTVVGGPPNDAKGCEAYFRASCLPNATAHTSAMLFSFSGPKSSPLPSPTQDRKYTSDLECTLNLPLIGRQLTLSTEAIRPLLVIPGPTS